MLSKLLKHEFRATGRIMGPLYLALLAVSVLSNVSIRLLDVSDSTVLNILGRLVLFLLGVAITAVFIMSVALMVNRFRTNLLGDEGYVMFTLPASIHQHIWSKIIVSTVWSIASFAAVCLAGVVTAFRVSYVDQFLLGLQDLFRHLTAYYAFNGAAFLIEGLVMVFAGCAASCLLFYAAMAVGHSFANHKTLLSVVFFLVFLFSLQFLSLTSLFGLDSMGFLTWNLGPVEAVHTAMGLGIASEALVGAIFYTITVIILKKRLNLE